MTFEELKTKYDKMQIKYGDKNLDSIYFGGCDKNPNICLVFMNPTGKNIASSKDWIGPKSPWVGTKNIWDLLVEVELIDKKIYTEIKSIKGSDWTVDFAKEVYKNISDHKVFITNLGKCTQTDARPLPDKVFKEYLKYLECEIELLNPKVIILFGNQVSSIVLGENISVSKTRKMSFIKNINGKEYKCYPVFYPVGNGRFNIDKSIEDIKWIMENEVMSTTK